MDTTIVKITKILSDKVFLHNSVADTERLKHEINAIVEVLKAIGCNVLMDMNSYGQLHYIVEIDGRISFS